MSILLQKAQARVRRGEEGTRSHAQTILVKLCGHQACERGGGRVGKACSQQAQARHLPSDHADSAPVLQAHVHRFEKTTVGERCVDVITNTQPAPVVRFPEL